MYKDIKKIELHLHLDGSIRINTAEELLNESNLKEKMIVDDTTKNLTDYLKKFDIPNKIMQTRKNLIRVSKELVEDLEKDNVIYAEIRFAPNLHTKKGLTLEEIVDAVLLGINNPKIKTNLILCMMRGADYEDNKKIIDLAIKYKEKGVCAIDLAGDETNYPTYLYKDLFKYAKDNNILYTIHAGESGTPKDIMDAINYGCKRIGHGIKVINDETIMQELIKKQIPLEICLTSNIQTHVSNSYEQHPIKKLYDKNILITINTDNRTVSNTTLNNEYSLLNKTFNFTEEDFKLFNINAINNSFLDTVEKEKLLKKLN